MEQSLWEKYWADRNVENRNKLVERYRPLVASVAQSLSAKLPQSVTFGELCSFGHEALIKLIRRFDPSLCSSFSTYAVPLIRHRMIDGIRQMDHLSRHHRAKGGNTCCFLECDMPLYHMRRAEDDDWVGDREGVDLSHPAEADNRDYVEWLISKVGPFAGLVLRGLYLEDKTQAQIAAELGVHYSTISLAHKRALQDLLESYPDLR